MFEWLIKCVMCPLFLHFLGRVFLWNIKKKRAALLPRYESHGSQISHIKF